MDFISKKIVNNQAFKTVTATSDGKFSVNVKRLGEASINEVSNMRVSSIKDGDDLIMVSMQGKNFILGHSPFTSSKEIEEVD